MGSGRVSRFADLDARNLAQFVTLAGG